MLHYFCLLTILQLAQFGFEWSKIYGVLFGYVLMAIDYIKIPN